MIEDISLTVSPETASKEHLLMKRLKEKMQPEGMDVKSFRIIRKSIDARRKPVKINLTVRVSDKPELPVVDYIPKNFGKLREDAPKVIIIGLGPAGLFAGLKAIELGLRPIIIERGKDVDSRRIDIAEISRKDKVNPKSNYCFGEGGAGAFSDGKLYTRSKKRGNNREVLEILHQFGASDDILVNAHPHIGSDRLPGIIKKIREKIIECGGEVRFNTIMEELLIEDNKVKGIKTSDGETLYGPVFLGIGHSARDTFRMLRSKGVEMEAKGIAVGVRLEHPQSTIDKIQYHDPKGRGEFLPPAEYNFVTQVNERGVYSFCMCPGGVIVPAVSEPDQIVVNGMSASARSGKWSNSGMVVEIQPEDIEGEDEVMKVLDFQENLEKSFSEESKGSLNAPAQRVTDFINNRLSEDLPKTSYAPGIHPARLDLMFPKEISSRLQEGFQEFGRKCKGFITPEGIMIGLESRTSSPIRLTRDVETMESKNIRDLYPMGEGAGYAGGIVSSAVDGINSMNSYYRKVKANG